jgi:putative transposase
MLYVLQGGICWRDLPRDLPPWQVSLSSLAGVGGVWTSATRAGRTVASLTPTRTAQNGSGGQSKCADHPKRGGGKKVKGSKRHRVVDSQGDLLGVMVTGADVSDARGAYGDVRARRRRARTRSVRVVIADKA